MNVRFKRLNKPEKAIACPSLHLPNPVVIDDWLKRDRAKRERQKEDQRPRIRLPATLPDTLPQEKEPDRGEVIIDINPSDDLVN